jgi:hypothetical protein
MPLHPENLGNKLQKAVEGNRIHYLFENWMIKQIEACLKAGNFQNMPYFRLPAGNWKLAEKPVALL